MKILVVSDTHGKMENLREVIDIEQPDRIYHLGDGQGVEDRIWMLSAAPCECVSGNCDFGVNLPHEVVLEVGKHVILLTHGHYYGVNYGYDKLIDVAEQKGCDVVLYGHTHVPCIDKVASKSGKVFVVANPGSISSPRQNSREHTYMLINVDSTGEFQFGLHSLEEYDRKNGN